MITKYDELMSDPAFRREMAVELLVAQASELIAQLMVDQKLSKADLARKLGKSRAWVTQLLSGKANVTIRTLAEIAYALGSEVRLQPMVERKHTAERGREVWKPIAGDTQAYVVSRAEPVFHERGDEGNSDEGVEPNPVTALSEYAA